MQLIDLFALGFHFLQRLARGIMSLEHFVPDRDDFVGIALILFFDGGDPRIDGLGLGGQCYLGVVNDLFGLFLVLR